MIRFRVIFLDNSENQCIFAHENRESPEKDYPFSASDPTKVKIPSGSSRKADFLNIDQMTELYEFFVNGEIPKEYKHPDEMRQSLSMFLAQLPL